MSKHGRLKEPEENNSGLALAPKGGFVLERQKEEPRPRDKIGRNGKTARLHAIKRRAWKKGGVKSHLRKGEQSKRGTPPRAKTS